MKRKDKKGAVRFAVSFVLAVLVVLSFSMPSSAQKDAMKFDLLRWDKDLFDILNIGPYILSRDTKIVIAPYPENDSEETQAELKALHGLVSARDDDTKTRIVNEARHGLIWNFFIADGLLHADNYKTIKLFERVDYEITYFIINAKKVYARPRPTDLDETLSVVIDVPAHAAYPSGHAAQSYIVALILAEFDPKHAEEYLQFARDIAHRREIAGIHFSSDSVAGRKLAVDVLAELHKSETFEIKFQEAKASYIKPELQTKELIEKED